MAQQDINFGTAPAGTDGDTIRAALGKVQANTKELYANVSAAQGSAGSAQAAASAAGTVAGNAQTAANAAGAAAAANATAIAGIFTGGFKNRLINGDFSVVQRSFGGGALAAGAYGYDRWKADTSGANFSVASGRITLNSGTLVQIIEAPGLAGKTVTISVNAPSAAVNVTVDGQTGTIAAGSGQCGVSFTIAAGSTGNITVKLGGVATFGQVQLAVESSASTFEWRPASVELSLCQRYYEKSYSQGVPPGSIGYGGANATGVGGVPAGSLGESTIVFKVTKRTIPSITIYSPATGASGKVRDASAGADVNVSMGNQGDSGAIWWATSIAGYVNLQMHFVAEAEL